MFQSETKTRAPDPVTVSKMPMPNRAHPLHAFLSLCVAAAIALSACATPAPKPEPPPRAKPAGTGVRVPLPVVTLAEGTTCTPESIAGVDARFLTAAQTALTQVGFRVTEETDAPYTAILALEVNYCSDAGIVSGTTALDLQKQKKAASVSIWHGEAKGDQARAETATSTLDELMNKLIYAPAVVNALNDGSAG